MSAQPMHEHGPKYFVNIEGTEEPWREEWISVAEIRELASWEATRQVVEVDLEDNTERTLTTPTRRKWSAARTPASSTDSTTRSTTCRHSSMSPKTA